MEINKIIALGDIHIFRSKRFDEHQNLFNKFYKILEEEKPDLVVIPGDVIDSKVNISPEQVILLQNLLLNITNHAPIVQILGNHDLNLQNIERKDLISAIINSIEGQTKFPIHFFPHSGIYPVYGINWAVWSCLDNQLNPYTIEGINVNPTNKNYTIGLFHGAVGGCLSDTGMELSDGIDVTEFDPCNICILSDIHKRQSFRNNDINYTGNFIQVKENEVPHGTYLVYHFDEKLGKHIPTVKNLDNEFSTLVYEITDINELPVFDKIYPDQIIKLAYNHNDISKADVLEYKKKLQKQYSNKIDYKPIVPQKKKTNYNLSEEEQTQELVKSFKELLKKFLEERKGSLKFLNDPEIDFENILELDKQFGGDLSADNTFEAGDFYFEKIIINNLFSFGPEDTETDLFEKDGINGINGENRAGKTKIIASLMFALYGTKPKALSSSKKLINKDNRDKPAYVELFIFKNGNRYKIKRSIEPISPKTEKVKYVLEFDLINDENKSIQNLRGEQRPDTEKIIERFFGTEETFELLSMFSAQKKQVEFIDCLNAQRLEHTNKFMGLQAFEIKFKESNNELTTKNKVYQELLKDFNDKINIDDLEAELQEINEEFIELENENQESNKLIKIDEEKITELNTQYQKYKLITETEYEDIDYIKYKISKEQDKIDKINNSKYNKEIELNEIENKRNNLNNSIFPLEIAIKENIKKIEELKNIGKNIKIEFQKKVNSTEEKEILFDLVDFYKNDITALTKKIGSFESEIVKKEKQLRIDICDNCSKEFTEKDKENTRIKIKELQNKVINTNVEINDLLEKEAELKELSKKCKDIISEISKIDSETSNKKYQIGKIDTEKSTLETEIQKIENKYLGIDNEISKIKMVILEFEKQIIEVEKLLAIIEDAEKKLEPIKQAKKPIEEHKNLWQTKLNNNNIRSGELKQKQKQINKEIADYKSKYENIKSKEEEVRLVSLYREIVAKDGLPLFILRKQIGAINTEINTIINQIFDFDLQFIINEETSELKIEFVYDEDKDKSDVALASGSETFIINLCIRVGLSQISEIPKCLSLIVDEGFGTLDKKNVDKIPLLFSSLLNYYKNIILISHLDELKDIYDNEIFVEKKQYTKIS